MAPTPKSHLSTTPSSKSHHSRTPLSKRLNFTIKETTAAAAPPPEHPVEVIGRIRNHPETKTKSATNSVASALQINTNEKSVRVKTEIGYRDFSLDGLSLSEQDDLDGFYEKFVQSRINGVKMGSKCTIMMYGPTGSGKSHTMFGCVKQPGIVYKALKDILGEGVEEDGVGMFVHVTVLEIYNEEIYDLLSNGSNGGGGFSLGWSKGGSASKVRLEVMGKKAKNATFISGNEAGKILKEIQKVEKRRIVKSTHCNERSSRSHCMIILDVPTVGGQLLLVDMAGSENIEQAGQTGFEAKMQTGKINQGNTALKRVVESIANGDSHVPFRDSKLTMLLQDSFEDDKSKILMILCASPDPKELHKTIATLEYGAKAKCIVRGPHTPIKEKGGEDSSQAVILGSRIAALDQFIRKLQVENKIKEKECEEAQKKLKNKEEEVSLLKVKLSMVEKRGTEEEVNLRVSEVLKIELERVKECEKMANEIVEMERRKMEENMVEKQKEMEMLRRRLEEKESEIRVLKGENVKEGMEEGGGFMQRLLEVCYDDSDMVKSMDLDKSIDMETSAVIRGSNTISACSYTNNFRESVQDFASKACLTTVFEEEEIESDDLSDEEVQKEVIEEKTIIDVEGCGPHNASSRELMIQNILTICGASDIVGHERNEIGEKEVEKLKFSDDVKIDLKENQKLFDENCGDIEVYVKWEASKENPGKFITTLKVMKESTLADLRKLIEIHLGAEQQGFTFLVLGDPSGAPVAREKEVTTETIKLPVCNNKVRGRLACLRPLKPIQGPLHLPFSSIENKLVDTPTARFVKKGGDDCLSPTIPQRLNVLSIPVRLADKHCSLNVDACNMA